jgi:hypothetical protein
MQDVPFRIPAANQKRINRAPNQRVLLFEETTAKHFARQRVYKSEPQQ